MGDTSSAASSSGISLGSAIAVCVSWSLYHSITWAVIHGIFGWFYVFYFVVTRD